MNRILFILSVSLGMPAFGSPVDCYKAIPDKWNFSVQDAVVLCSGAKSLAPIDCFKQAAADKALSNAWNSADVTLCSGAVSNAPVDCYKAIPDKWNFSVQDAVLLCSGATSLAPIDCFKKAATDKALSNAWNTAMVTLCSEKGITEQDPSP